MDTAVKEFNDEMEKRFGTDEALGVWFEKEADGTALTLQEFNEMFEKVGRDKMPATISLFPNGGSACCCTDYAIHIYQALTGRVQIFGFANKDNPTSRVAREGIHPSGHDYAIVDKRFIVDPWPRLVPMVFRQMVFDLNDATDAQLVRDIYGPRECWSHMQVTEQYAEDMLAGHVND